MKKLFIIITLFLSSFFFVSLKDVRADEVTLDINFDLIDDTFLEVKRLSDELLQSSTVYDNYVIVYKSGYFVHFFSDTATSNIRCGNRDEDIYCIISKNHVKYSFSSSSSSLISGSTSSSWDSYYYDSKFNNILYSTFPLLYNRGSDTNLLHLNYNGFTKTILYEDYIPLVYDLYLVINSSEKENPHQEEIDKVTNFYTMIIEKIGYLSEQIANNYILLFIIGIFILIFVFMLIFRRFL